MCDVGYLNQPTFNDFFTHFFNLGMNLLIRILKLVGYDEFMPFCRFRENSKFNKITLFTNLHKFHKFHKFQIFHRFSKST